MDVQIDYDEVIKEVTKRVVDRLTKDLYQQVRKHVFEENLKYGEMVIAGLKEQVIAELGLENLFQQATIRRLEMEEKLRNVIVKDVKRYIADNKERLKICVDVRI